MVRERAALGEAELVAKVLAGQGGEVTRWLEPAWRLLDRAGGLGGLGRGRLRAEVARGEGVGADDFERLATAIELGRRANEAAALRAMRSFVGAPEVAEWGRAKLAGLAHEELWMLALDVRNGLVAELRVAQGGLCGCSTSQSDVLRLALRAGAHSFVLVHNHPSGQPTPSPDDEKMTWSVATAARMVGVPLVDHVIIGGRRYTSMKDEGLVD